MPRACPSCHRPAEAGRGGRAGRHDRTDDRAFPIDPAAGTGLSDRSRLRGRVAGHPAICDLHIGPYEGKQTGESALLRGILDSLRTGEVAVFDRGFCSFLMPAILLQRGVHFCTRLHQRRPVDFPGAGGWGTTITE